MADKKPLTADTVSTSLLQVYLRRDEVEAQLTALTEQKKQLDESLAGLRNQLYALQESTHGAVEPTIPVKPPGDDDVSRTDGSESVGQALTEIPRRLGDGGAGDRERDTGPEGQEGSRAAG